MSAVFSALEIPRRWIASPAVPITVDSENAPASRPAAVPMSYPRSFANPNAVSRHVTHRTTVSATCGMASRFSPRKNCGPTLYPVVKRKSKKKIDFTVEGTLMFNCPITTPASSVPTTVPRLKLPILTRPIRNPTARVRKTASSGLSRSACTKKSTVHLL